MAMRWTDGFEVWAHPDWFARAYASGTAGINVNPRVAPGTRSAELSTSALTTPSLGLQNTWFGGIGMKFPSLPTPSQVAAKISILRGATEQCRIEAVTSSAGFFQLRIVRGSTTIATTSSEFAANAWRYIEFKIVARGSTNGEYEIRVNEQTELSGTGVNLAESGSDGADAFGFAQVGVTTQVDDIYLLDDTGSDNNTFRGDSVMFAIYPTADGHQNDFTPSTGGDNYALVDDAGTISPNISDYVSSDTNGHQDFFEFEDLPTTGIGSIFSLKVVTGARMDAVGSRVLRPVYYDGGTEFSASDDFTVTGTVGLDFPIIMEVNPDTSSAWTKSEVDAGEFGIEVVS